MPSAYVLINCDLGYSKDISRYLREIVDVKEVGEVNGVYDLVAKVESGTVKDLRETLTWKIRTLAKINSTLTLMQNNEV